MTYQSVLTAQSPVLTSAKIKLAECYHVLEDVVKDLKAKLIQPDLDIQDKMLVQNDLVFLERALSDLSRVAAVIEHN